MLRIHKRVSEEISFGHVRYLSPTDDFFQYSVVLSSNALVELRMGGWRQNLAVCVVPTF